MFEISKKQSLQFQFQSAINKSFSPGHSKRADRSNPLADSSAKVYSFMTRKELMTTAYDFARFLKTEYGIKDLKSIRPEMTQAFLNGKAGSGDCKHITIKQYQSRINKLEKVCSNLVRGPLDFTTGVHIEKTADNSKSRNIALHRDEYKALCNIKTSSNAQIGVKLAYQFGLRESELVKLRPSDWKSDGLHIVDSKGGKSRVVPIVTKEQISVLREFKTKCPHGLELRTGSINKWMNRTCKVLGLDRITESKSKIHACRKAYAQRCYLENRKSGLTHKEAWKPVSKALGHGNRPELFKVYCPEL